MHRVPCLVLLLVVVIPMFTHALVHWQRAPKNRLASLLCRRQILLHHTRSSPRHGHCRRLHTHTEKTGPETEAEKPSGFSLFPNPLSSIYQKAKTFFSLLGTMGNWASHKMVSPQLKFEDIEVVDIDGKSRLMSEFSNKVLLISNVASQCGLSKQHYQDFVELHTKYFSRDFEILAFPCSQFGNQEFKTNEEIKNFQKKNGAKFLVFDKVQVNGANAHPLFQHLKALSGEFGSASKLAPVGWNFGKFLVNRNADVVTYYGPRTRPMAMEGDILKLLNNEAVDHGALHSGEGQTEQEKTDGKNIEETCSERRDQMTREDTAGTGSRKMSGG